MCKHCEACLFVGLQEELESITAQVLEARKEKQLSAEAAHQAELQKHEALMLAQKERLGREVAEQEIIARDRAASRVEETRLAQEELVSRSLTLWPMKTNEWMVG